MPNPTSEEGQAIKAEATTAASPWLAEYLRFSAFAPSGTQWPVRTLFSELIGGLPKQIIERPPMGIKQEMGDLGGGALLMIGQSARRVDIVISVDASVAAAQPLAQLGPLGEWSEKLRPIVEAWIRGGRSVGRLAYGTACVAPMSGASEAIDRLATLVRAVDFTPAHANPNKMRDVLWQVNRRRQSKSGSAIEINRLQKWSIIETTLAEFEGASFATLPAVIAVRCELDINTSPEQGISFAPDQQSALWMELEAITFEIADKGDIP